MGVSWFKSFSFADFIPALIFCLIWEPHSRKNCRCTLHIRSSECHSLYPQLPGSHTGYTCCERFFFFFFSHIFTFLFSVNRWVYWCEWRRKRIDETLESSFDEKQVGFRVECLVTHDDNKKSVENGIKSVFNKLASVLVKSYLYCIVNSGKC